MNKFILICSLFGVCVLTHAQSITEIKSGAELIDGKIVNSFYNQDIKQYKEILSILQLDVFEYYDLDSLYNSDAKKSTFKASAEYASKLAELQQKQTALKQRRYVLDFEPLYYERNVLRYSIPTKTFKVTNEVYTNKFYDEDDYVQFDEIIFKSLRGIENDREKMKAGNVNYIKENLFFKIDDDFIGNKIQENRLNLRILYVFKFTEAIPFEGIDLFGKKTTFYALASTLEKVLVYNVKTGEIFKEFKVK